MHSPIVHSLTPSANAEHSLSYVIPSPPQTGAYISGQAFGSLSEQEVIINKRKRNKFFIYQNYNYFMQASLAVSLTYLRGLEVSELEESDMPVV
jgi:hypothetical protein